ncbi:hypothetical protein AU252_09755 [Pseudarthrobacter sulfonivorans]|uniref:Uncharacterized protein n=1 Tax=Pseudarthrobacter sulfonivorans TaxID=121292 RepID=A0A0U3FRA1_9MICC|nr:hypothetical protein [Pseudarthrobacter sulfonivorans]ALV41399.1 hypothetical protein AU252_09755 [Pseudarthrobacter sulfonivorans]
MKTVEFTADFTAEEHRLVKLIALNDSLQKIKLDNAALIEKNGRNTELEISVQSLKKQDALLNLIAVQQLYPRPAERRTKVRVGKDLQGHDDQVGASAGAEGTV